MVEFTLKDYEVLLKWFELMFAKDMKKFRKQWKKIMEAEAKTHTQRLAEN